MSVRIGLGIATFPFRSPSSFFRWAELCEEKGVDSLWQTDRLVSPDAYLEAISAVAALAGITERVRFGMNAVVAPLRDPLVLAKQCATIDFLSGGRMLPMFGVGYPGAAEWRATGRDPKTRGRQANEMFELMARLWAEEKVTFEGEFYRYEEATIAPRPIQQPMPLWIGGNSKAAIKRTARLGNGWIGGIATPDQTRQVIRDIKAELEVTGREIDADHFGASLAFRVGRWEDDAVQNFPLLRRAGIGDDIDLKPLLCVGSVQELIGRLKEYREAGASKFVLLPIADGEDDVFHQTQQVVEDVIPAIEG